MSRQHTNTLTYIFEVYWQQYIFLFYISHNVTTVIHRKVSGEHISSHAHMLVEEKERELDAHGEDESREKQIQ